MTTESAAQQKRGIVGLIAIVCLAGGSGLFVASQLGLGFASTGWQSLTGALVRVGILMAVLWVALPSKTRPAAWARISPWTLVGIVAVAIFWRYLKFSIPIALAVIAIGWFLRPRAKRRP